MIYGLIFFVCIAISLTWMALSFPEMWKTFITILTSVSGILVAWLPILLQYIKKINFEISLCATIKKEEEGIKKYIGTINVTNLGSQPIYFKKNNVSKTDMSFTVFSLNDDLYFKIWANKSHYTFYNKYLETKEQHIEIIKQKDDSHLAEHQLGPYSTGIKSGDIIHFKFDYSEHTDFFKKGKAFYIKEATGKRFYLTKNKTKEMQEVLNNNH